MNNFNCNILFKISREVMLFALFVPTWIIIKSGYLSKIGLILSSQSSIVTSLNYCNLTSYLSVFKRCSHFPKIFKSPTMATVLLGYYFWITLVTAFDKTKKNLSWFIIWWLTSLSIYFLMCFFFMLNFSFLFHLIGLKRSLYQLWVAQSFFQYC